VPLNSGVFLPVLTSRPPGERAKLAVIVLHGALRNVEEYFSNAVSVVNEWPCGKVQTVIVAPAIANKPCRGDQWGFGDAYSFSLTWATTRQWAMGQMDDRAYGISSYQALDLVLAWIQQQYQGLQLAVVTGFSTGAQLALRWSVLSVEGSGGTTRAGLPLRTLVGAPSNVLYLDDTRPSEECTTDTEDARCSSFPLPETGSRRRGTHVQKTCSGGYDQFEFGLGGLDYGAAGTERGDAARYLREGLGTVADLTAAVRARFASKDVRFLVGTTDTKPCTVGACSEECGAMVTGVNRKQRMLNYMGHLEAVLGKPPRLGIFEGGHKHLLAFQSEPFANWTLAGLVTDSCNAVDEFMSLPTSAGAAAALHRVVVVASVSGLLWQVHSLVNSA